MERPPLVVTLALAAEDQERFDRLRRQHFPPERNHLAAHVTLFHALPGDREDEVLAVLAAVAPAGPFPVPVTGLRLLGRGVAYRLESPVLASMHARLSASFAAAFGPGLTRQDRQRLAAHVTVQNKVSPERARALHADLQSSFAAFEITATGTSLWRYLGGPWEPVTTVPFGGGLRE